MWTRRWRPLPSTISAFLTPLALPLRRLRSTVVQPFSPSSFFGFSTFAGRDPPVFVFVLELEPSLRIGDPVAYLECINDGGGDSSLTVFGFLEVAGGEAPFSWAPARCVGGGRCDNVWRVAR